MSILGALRLLACVPLLPCALTQNPVADPPGQATVRTAHYTVRIDGQGEAADREAIELGAVLEASWKQFADVLHAEPALKNASAFEVRLQADKKSWTEALRASGVEPSKDLDSLCYVPEHDLVLLYRQPSVWYTRRLAIHGAWQQFHCRAKSKHADLVNTWFVLGLAEQFAQHRWDGRKLELAVHPRITVIDLPKQALGMFDPSDAGLNRFAEAGLRQPALSWALVSFLREAKDQKYRARFDKLALGQTGSKLTGPEFAASLGKAGQISLELKSWLDSIQEPLTAASGDWEDLDGRVLWARASSEDFAFALIKASALEVSARFELSPESAAGLVIAWTDKHHYSFATVSDRGVRVERCNGNQLSVLGEYQAPPALNGMHV